MHPRYLTPTVSTITMGAASAALYLAFNYLSHGFVISDAVTAIGLYIAFYYGLTGFACAFTSGGRVRPEAAAAVHARQLPWRGAAGSWTST